MSEEATEFKSDLVAQRSYRCAVLCGTIPLLMGVCIFLVWWRTRWLWLMNAGLLNIVAGLLIVSFGLLCLARFWKVAPSTPNKNRRILACLALFVSNFIAAGVITITAIAIATAFSVELRNHSRDTIRNAELVGGGCRFVFDAVIPPGVNSRRTHWIKRDDDELKFVATGEDKSYRESFSYYVTSNLGGSHSIVIEPDGSVRFEADGDNH